jgi:hypothetical protein
MRVGMMNVNENENLRIDNNSDEIYIIRKSWWGVLSSSLFTAILPVVFFSFAYFIVNGLFSTKFLSFTDNLKNFQNKTYYYIIGIIFIAIIVLKILDVIFDSI